MVGENGIMRSIKFERAFLGLGFWRTEHLESRSERKCHVVIDSAQVASMMLYKLTY